MCQQGGWLKCLKQRENMQAAARQINFRLRKFNHVTTQFSGRQTAQKTVLY